MVERNESVLRRWSALIRTEDEAEYVRYVEATGLEGYAAVPGDLGFQLLLRPLGDGRSEVTTLSWWTDLQAIAAFAGEDPELARYYPDDDRFLLTRPDRVEHHRVTLDGVRPKPA